MNPFIDTQELARRCNEEEAVWREYERLRQLRRRYRFRVSVPTDILDRLDWLKAERVARVIRCVGASLL
ncbi:MAG: hypothetical protein Q8N04_00330 [Nitrospira sp.]|nr:hypothetical protein [Nitrospira sp.]